MQAEGRFCGESHHKSDGKNAQRDADRSASSYEMQGQSYMQAVRAEQTISGVADQKSLNCTVAFLPVGKLGYCSTSILLSYHPCRCLLIEIPPSAAHSQCAPMYDKLHTISCTTAHSDWPRLEKAHFCSLSLAARKNDVDRIQKQVSWVAFFFPHIHI